MLQIDRADRLPIFTSDGIHKPFVAIEEIDFDCPAALSFTLRSVSEPFGNLSYHADLHCLVMLE